MVAEKGRSGREVATSSSEDDEVEEARKVGCPLGWIVMEIAKERRLVERIG